MKKQQSNLFQELFPEKVIIESTGKCATNKNVRSAHPMLSRLMILSIIILFTIPSVFAQSGDYYTNDQAAVTIKTQQAPPPIPDYVQPECPGDGYYWTPGYWAWASNDYYWVPGVWVMPPSVNLLWTPGYWAFVDDFYGWYPGYWGAQVGYYGGINYGFGYFGTGFYGGRWDGGRFMYNTSVWRVGRNVHNTYINKVTINNRNRASFNGRGGVDYRPNGDEMRGIQNHTPANMEQRNHEMNMGNEKGQFHGINPKPMVHSMSAPGGQRFNDRGREMRMGGGGGGGGRRGGRG